MAADSVIVVQFQAPPRWAMILVGLLVLARVPWLPGFILGHTIRVTEVPARG